jgi:superfamily I DNA/RNA helicase|tara:strand:- start:36 stop:1601 length:1566 start_codon:yes stop_codon:yes gene_type:complete
MSNKLQFMVGPPGTGKTSTFITSKYVELLKKFNYEKIIILSHTNVAADEIKDEILKLPEMKGVTKTALEHNICTIHHYCKKKATIGEQVLDYDDYKNLCIIDSIFQRHKVTESEFNNREHGYFKFVKEAYGFNRSLKEHWKISNKKYHGYSINNIENMVPIVEKYNKENGKLDFPDMIKRFIDKSKNPDIKALIVDEAQDSNKTQKIALDKISRNADEYWFVGDPDQTIFEWAGADAREFYELSKGAKELEQGHRCSQTINALCKEIIKPIWDYYGTHRIWKPTDIVGKHHKLASLSRDCSSLQLLINKIKNTKETFLFTYRQKPVDAWIRKFLIRHGIQFAYLENSPYVSNKELECHKLWPKFIKGKPMSLKQIKDFWNYMGSKVVVRGEGQYDFEDWIDKDYTIHDLIKLNLLKQSSVQEKDFTLIALKNGLKQEEFDKKMIYIKKVIRQGGLDEKPRVKYANIHKVKGLTFDNVIVDNSRFQPEDYFTQLRLKYVAYSRGKYDCWTIASQDKYTLGVR